MYKIRGKPTKHVQPAYTAKKNDVPKYSNKFDALCSDDESDADKDKVKVKDDPVEMPVVVPVVVDERFADLPEPSVKVTEKPYRKQYGKTKEDSEWDAPKRKDKVYHDFVPKVIVTDGEREDEPDDPRGDKMFLASN